MSKIVSFNNLRGASKPMPPQKQISVMIGMLSAGNMVNWETQECVDAMLVHMAQNRLPDGRCLYQIRKYTARVTNIFAGRNKLCKSAIENKCDWLLMIDSDMTFPADSFKQIFRHGKDIISALAFKKSYPYTPVIARKTNKDQEYSTYGIIGNWVDNALLKIDGVGTAFLLINMDIIRKMEEPWFFHEWLPKTKTILGSDYYFCAKAQNLGHDIWVDTSLKIGHTGTYNYGFADYLAHGGPVKQKSETGDPSTDYETLSEYKVRWDKEHPEEDMAGRIAIMKDANHGDKHRYRKAQ